jgi:hypothetical protein
MKTVLGIAFSFEAGAALTLTRIDRIVVVEKIVNY